MRHRAPAGVLLASLVLSACGGGGNGSGTFAPATAGSVPVLAGSPSDAASVPIPSAQIDAAVAKLDGLAADIMRRSNIPGMAVAVVKDGRTVYAKGFGVRRIGAGDRVDADTVFQLASMSKPVGATVVAGLVGRQTVSWDTPVTTPLPGFALSDPTVTWQVTIGDFYAHRTGLPEHVGDDLEDLGYDRSQVLQRMRYVPLKGFRARYAYTNFGLTAGAEAAASAAGLDWATLSERTLYQPLGMNSTSSRFADFMQRTNRAWPHVLSDGRYQALYQRQPDAQSPAGGVSASVNDLTHWLTLLLQKGTYEGRELVKADALLPATSAQVVSAPASSANERPGFYGYGFVVGSTGAGRLKLGHSGAFLLGASTAFTAIPSSGVAIVTLTNAAPVGAAEALNSAFEDLLETGQVTRDWYAYYYGLFQPLYAPVGSLVGQLPPALPVAALASSAYIGTYANSYYGNAVVEASGSALVLKMGPGGAKVYPLRHWSGNAFVFDLLGESGTPGSMLRMDFTPGAGGVSASAQIEYYAEDTTHGVFVRMP